MSLNSPLFLFAFLPVTITAHWLLPSRLRNPLLLTASLAFYLFGDQAHFFILLLAITVNYLVAWPLARATGGRRRLLLALAVWFDLALLGLAKYGGWLADHGVLNERLVISRSLPLGISFFIFAMLSYLFDIRRGHAAVERSLPRFTLFVTLFPKLVAGPIARYRDLAGQLGVRRFSLPLFATGVQRFVLGLGKKLLIANTLAPIVDEIFALPRAGLTPALAWLGAVSYGLQIYFDFSGYSDMAVGLGRLFGFQFVENFNYPYVASSIREFWQRWHISLSTWFRDYLFLPLAYSLSRRVTADRLLGIRADLVIYAVAMMTTMVLCGMWHGAQWTFALWGLWHGFFLVVENSTPGKRLRRRLGGPLRFALTQLIVLAGWVVFRANGSSQIGVFFAAMAGFGGNGQGIAEPARVIDYLGRAQSTALVAGLIGSLPVSDYLRTWLGQGLDHLPTTARLAVRTALSVGAAALLMALFLFCAMTLAGGTFNPFVYQGF